jgi:hypothetical protein
VKKAFIIDTYPKTEKQKETLRDCIESVKLIGWDILLVSHFPVPVEIQETVTYFIYDKNNSFVPPSITPHTFLSNSFFDSKVYSSGHALAITINMFNGFKFAECYGYDFCYFMESDSILSKNDINKLDNLVNLMELENKDMIIFNPENFIVGDCYHSEDGAFFYETLLFGAKTSQFLLNFKPPRNLDEWFSNLMCYNLEASFYDKYKNLKDKCLIIPSFVEEYLSGSKINSSRFGLFVCDLVFNKNNPESPVLLINNLNESGSTKEIKIFVNEILAENILSYPGGWCYRVFPLDDSVLKIEVLSGGVLESSKNFCLDSFLPKSLEENLSFIDFK